MGAGGKGPAEGSALLWRMCVSPSNALLDRPSDREHVCQCPEALQLLFLDRQVPGARHPVPGSTRLLFLDRPSAQKHVRQVPGSTTAAFSRSSKCSEARSSVPGSTTADYRNASIRPLVGEKLALGGLIPGSREEALTHSLCFVTSNRRPSPPYIASANCLTGLI